MAQRQRVVQQLATRLSELSEQVRLTRLVMYLFMILLIILCIMVILSLVYADSPDPTQLFATSDRIFSYSGDPLSVMAESSSPNYAWCDMIDNGSVFMAGPSLIYAKAIGPITLVAENGANWTTAGPLYITTDAGSTAATVSFMDGAMPGYFNNTHLYFSDAQLLLEHRGPNYNLILMSAPGTFKSYDNSFVAVDGGEPFYQFSNYLKLSGADFLVNDSGTVYPFRGALAFPGTLEMMTTGEMSTYLPINETDNLVGASRIVFMNTDGSLVVGGKEYECHGADNINASGAANDSMAITIKMGKVQAVGKVNSLVFRGQEYAAQPIKNFFRDGYFTIATGALTAMLALLAQQVFAEFRRK